MAKFTSTEFMGKQNLTTARNEEAQLQKPSGIILEQYNIRIIQVICLDVIITEATEYHL